MLQGIHAEVGEFGDLLTGGIDPDDATGILGSVVLRVEVCGKPSVCARHINTLPQIGRTPGPGFRDCADELGNGETDFQDPSWIPVASAHRQALTGATLRATGRANRVAATPTPTVTP